MKTLLLKEDIEQFIPKMMNLLKPDKIEEVKAVTKLIFWGFLSKNKVVTDLDIFQVFFWKGLGRISLLICQKIGVQFHVCPFLMIPV